MVAGSAGLPSTLRGFCRTGGGDLVSLLYLDPYFGSRLLIAGCPVLWQFEQKCSKRQW